MNLASTDKCFGCSACAVACPKSAIQMVPNDEGFLVPHMDKSKCVQCGVCERICPALNLADEREPKHVFAFQSADDDLRQKSSSGGFFSYLSEVVLSQGGVVFGAAVLEDLTITHIPITSREELMRLRGSKYVQSSITDALAQVKVFLASNRWVLFSGTSCQIAAVKALYPKATKLITVDVICFGVPSPLAWKCYKEGIEKTQKSKVKAVSFRDKTNGWNYNMALTFENGEVLRTPFMENLYLKGFLGGLYNRTSCYTCPMRYQRCGSDITMGDFWGIETVFPEMDDKKGTSLILVNTALGEDFFNKAIAWDACVIHETDWSIATRVNRSLIATGSENPKRSAFMQKLKRGIFDARFFKHSFPRRVLSFIYRKVLRRK